MGGSLSVRLSPAVDAMLAELPDLSGKVIAITSCSQGLGFYLAQAAARKGASKILLLDGERNAVRAAEKLRMIATPKTKVEPVSLDLHSLASVRNCAKRVAKKVAAHGGLDLLAVFSRRCTSDEQRQSNDLSQILLAQGLLQKLELATRTRGDARVVFQGLCSSGSPSRDLHKQLQTTGSKVKSLAVGLGFESLEAEFKQVASACFGQASSGGGLLSRSRSKAWLLCA
eukprot:gb/GFBE01021072.1/.p1 GENE.gb/GFBE01021072.1/~~gb/GFBE01021072.1/.p1  ORF type:complete len:228 (+),score=47.76 gb/GFBE01021072.1/:1-684(+)